MQKTLTDNLIKNSAVIAISNKISLLQRKIFNFLIAQAYANLEKEESYQIDLKHLIAIIGFNSKNIAYLKESLKQLMTTVVEFNLLGKDKTSWSATTLLSSVSFYQGKCIYSFSPILRQKLYQPNIYAKLKLSMMKLFSSKYALCLYEIFIDYNNIGQTPVIALDDFRKLMGIETHQYTAFKRLSLGVIKPALEELGRVGGYKVEVQYQREHRKVVALKFYFKATPTSTPKKPVLKPATHPTLQQRLIKEFGMSSRQATYTVKTYPLAYIKESLQIIKHKISQKVIKNVPAYTVTVLKNDYVALCPKQEESTTLPVKKSTSKVRHSALHTKDHTSLSANEKKDTSYFYAFGKTEQQHIIEAFEKEKICSDILKTLYKKEGLNSTMFKVMFSNYLSTLKTSKQMVSNLLG